MNHDFLMEMFSRLGRNVSPTIVGKELARFPEEYAEAVRHKNALFVSDVEVDSHPCRGASCEFDCDLLVRRREGGVFLECPRSLKVPQKIDPSSISVWRLDVQRLIKMVRKENGMKPSLESKETLSDSLLSIGAKPYGPYEFEIFFISRPNSKRYALPLLTIKKHLGSNIHLVAVFPPGPARKTTEIEDMIRREGIITINTEDLFQSEDLSVDFAFLATKVPLTEEFSNRANALLFIDRSKRIVRYKNHELDLQHQPYMLLMSMAAHPGRFWSIKELHSIMYPQTHPDNRPYDSQVDTHVSFIRKAFRKLGEQHKDVTEKEVRNVVENKKKIGYRLIYQASQIHIAG